MYHIYLMHHFVPALNRNQELSEQCTMCCIVVRFEQKLLQLCRGLNLGFPLSSLMLYQIRVGL
jgi:hypothetical protein